MAFQQCSGRFDVFEYLFLFHEGLSRNWIIAKFAFTPKLTPARNQ